MSRYIHSQWGLYSDSVCFVVQHIHRSNRLGLVHLKDITLLLFEALQKRICCLGIHTTVLLERSDQRLVYVWHRPSRTTEIKGALVLVQHAHKCLHIVHHLVLDIYFLGSVTRKGESCLGDDAVLDKCLDL